MIDTMRSRRLRAFFPYYGSKWTLAPRYQAPKHRTIVEPFAGSAGYATFNSFRAWDVVLCDLDPVIVGVWDYLIKASAEEIRALPLIEPGQDVRDLAIPQEAKWLIGFWLNRTTRPCNRLSSWGIRHLTVTGKIGVWCKRTRSDIAVQVDAIRHWRVFNCSYIDCPVTGYATWFVDPPYMAQGKHYQYGAGLLDYAELAKWCRARHGQVIVCENEGADWLPFQRLTWHDSAVVLAEGGKRSTVEVVWYGGDQ